MTGRLRAVPPGVAVGGSVVLCAAFLAWRALRVESYVWLIDELLYTKVARFYSDGLHVAPQVLGVTEPIPNTLYPLLLAPLYALFGNVTAFELAHVLNAILLASTIVPVYLIAHRLLALPWGYALAAGVGSVLVPWAVAVNVVMTESLAYPAFMWAIYGMARAFAQPGWRSDALALVLIGLAAWARTQFFLLAGIFVLAVVIHALAGGDARARLRPHLPLLGLVAGGFVLVLVMRAAGFDPLGTYGGTVNKPPFPVGWLGASGRHLAHIVVGVAIAPAILFFAWIPGALAQRESRGEYGFALVAVLTFGMIAYQVGFFSQAVAGGQYQERYAFYVVPLVMLGAMAVIARPSRAPRALLLVGAVAAAAMIAAADPQFPPGESDGAFARIANASSAMNTQIARWVATWTERLVGEPKPVVDTLVVVAFLMAILLGVLLHVARRRPVVAMALAGAIVLANALQLNYLMPASATTINQSYPGTLPGVNQFERDWIDRAVPDGARSGVLLGTRGVPDEQAQWQWHFFWNSTITRAYQPEGRPGFGDFQPQTLFPDAKDGRLLGPRQDATHLVVSQTDPTLKVRGREIARVADGTAILVPERPWRADWLLQGEPADQRLYVFPPTGGGEVRGRAEIEIEAPDVDGIEPVRFRVTSGERTVERTVAPGASTTVRVAFAGAARAVVAIETLDPQRSEDDSLVTAVVARVEMLS